MNRTFKSFLNFGEQDRIEVFTEAARRLRTLPRYVEKDFGSALFLTHSITVCPRDIRNCFSRAEHPCPRRSGSSIVSRRI